MLITIIRDLIQHDNSQVVLSSRPYPMFDRAFSSRAMLRLQDLTRADIKILCQTSSSLVRDSTPGEAKRL